VRVAGERATRVWPEIEEVSAAKLEATARVELQRASAGREATFTLKETVAPVKVPLGDGASKLVARGPSSSAKSGVIGVPVEVLVDGARYRTVWTSWRVEVWETRPVLSRPVQAGEPLTAQHFERARVAIGTEVGMDALDPTQVSGAIARRDLAPGDRITEHDVHRPAAVTLGAMLFLRVKKGAIEARVSALALETGAVGERIRVKTIEAGQELLATVIGRDLCEISL
jgi:flagella basal body P-ring formation protein FlgA